MRLCTCRIGASQLDRQMYFLFFLSGRNLFGGLVSLSMTEDGGA